MNTQNLADRYCNACQKAKSACICHFIHPIECDIPIIILQHPSEVKKAIGTARIVDLALPNAKIFIGENFTNHEAFNQYIDESDHAFSLIYLNDQATPLKEKETRQDSPKMGFIFIDGTWKKTVKMYHLSRNLQQFPCAQLDISSKSSYRIRKTTKKQGLSTVEAVFHTLSHWGGDSEKYTNLLSAFNKMIDFQIERMPPEVFKRHYQDQ